MELKNYKEKDLPNLPKKFIDKRDGSHLMIFKDELDSAVFRHLSDAAFRVFTILRSFLFFYEKGTIFENESDKKSLKDRPMKNDGWITFPWSLAKSYFRSKDRFVNAIKELEENSIIEVNREKGKPSKYRFIEEWEGLEQYYQQQ